MEVAPSTRLLASVAEVMSLPARFWPADRTGIAPLSPDDLASAYQGPMSHLFQQALAQDLGNRERAFPDSVMVALKTDPALQSAVRIAAAPFEEILVALRHLAAAIHARSVNSAVRKADRTAILDCLGDDAVMTAQRQADVFFPSLRFLALDQPVQTLTQSGEANADPDSAATDARWQRPAVSGQLAALPPALKRAYDVLCLYVGSINQTIADLLCARFGERLTSGDTSAEKRLSLSPIQASEIRDLLERKVPAWSITIA